MTDAEHVIKTIERFTSASAFLDHLFHLSSDVGPPEFRSPWVYRGHGDAGWALKPPAWREDGQIKLAPLKTYLCVQVRAIVDRYVNLKESDRENALKFATQCAAEVVAVRQFCNLADELGIEIPDADLVMDATTAVETLTNVMYRPILLGAASLPMFIDIPFAFAQHHGIPTRYLDWTRKPLIAAYFAVDDPPNTDRLSDEVCVWATKQDDRMKHWLRWVTVPRSVHHYLHAQDGLFSFASAVDIIANKQDDWPSLEDVELLDTSGVLNSPPLELKQLVLPLSEAPKLRAELYAHGISRAHLMPTLDNVAKVTREMWDWYPW